MKLAFGIIGGLLMAVSFIAMFCYGFAEALEMITVQAMRESFNPWICAFVAGAIMSFPYWIAEFKILK